MLHPFKVSKVAQMNGFFRLRSYVNVYPISDSFEAASHLILSALLLTVPTRQFKSSATSSRVSSHSHHILIFKASRRDSTCQERYRRKKDDKTQIWRQGRTGQRDSLLSLWQTGLDNGSCIEVSVAVWGRTVYIQKEQELIGLETDEARAQLDCKAAQWGERAPCLPGCWLMVK